jgi:hypothetical protein
MADCVLNEVVSIEGDGMTGRRADEGRRISGNTAVVVSGEERDSRGSGDLAFQQDARWNR